VEEKGPEEVVTKVMHRIGRSRPLHPKVVGDMPSLRYESASHSFRFLNRLYTIDFMGNNQTDVLGIRGRSY